MNTATKELRKMIGCGEFTMAQPLAETKQEEHTAAINCHYRRRTASQGRNEHLRNRIFERLTYRQDGPRSKQPVTTLESKNAA